MMTLTFMVAFVLLLTAIITTVVFVVVNRLEVAGLKQAADYAATVAAVKVTNTDLKRVQQAIKRETGRFVTLATVQAVVKNTNHADHDYYFNLLECA